MVLDLEDGLPPEALDGPAQHATGRSGKALKRQAKTARKRARQPGARGWTDEDKNVLLRLVGGPAYRQQRMGGSCYKLILIYLLEVTANNILLSLMLMWHFDK